EWGVRYAGRKAGPLDRDFPLAPPYEEPSEADVREAWRRWQQYGIHEGDGRFIACFVGGMGRQVELDTVIEAARILRDSCERVTFLLCGDGDNLEAYREMAAGLDNVIFPGWIGLAEIRTLMQLSSVGLTPYHSTLDFRASIPNKAIDYFSAGLPVVSSLQGVLAGLLSEHDCGVTYANEAPEELAEALRRLHDDRGRVERMSGNAQALFEQRFRGEKVYSEMADYVEGLVHSAN
ncbi:MAG: glycosyltransferase, partial [Planctomycetota bacterium]